MRLRQGKVGYLERFILDIISTHAGAGHPTSCLDWLSGKGILAWRAN
jgi:hypothetical protein